MKNIKWLIQTTGFKQSQVFDVYNILDNLNYNIQDFGLIATKNIITNLENIILNKNEKYIIRGGTKVLSTLNSIHNISELNPYLDDKQIKESNHFIHQLKNAIDYDINSFDQKIYSQYDLPLLNNKTSILPYKEVRDNSYSNDMFIKPTRDLKAFNGGILKKGTTIHDFIMNNHYQSYYKDEFILINPIKKIDSEYRFFIVDGKVITGSLYKFGDKVIVDNYIPPHILQYAELYAKLYQPADIFVMDLASCQGNISIIEYNCWNASGLYAVDMKKLFSTVHEFKS